MSFDKKSGYYDAGGIETISIIKAKLTPEQFIGYLLGNIIKYTCRVNFKHTQKPNLFQKIISLIFKQKKKDSFDRDIEKIANYGKMLRENGRDNTD